MVAKTRPVVIVSRYEPNPPRALVIYVPLTGQNRGSKYEVEMPKLHFLREESVANIQGVALATSDATGTEARSTARRAIGQGKTSFCIRT